MAGAMHCALREIGAWVGMWLMGLALSAVALAVLSGLCALAWGVVLGALWLIGFLSTTLSPVWAWAAIAAVVVGGVWVASLARRGLDRWIAARDHLSQNIDAKTRRRGGHRA